MSIPGKLSQKHWVEPPWQRKTQNIPLPHFLHPFLVLSNSVVVIDIWIKRPYLKMVVGHSYTLKSHEEKIYLIVDSIPYINV